MAHRTVDEFPSIDSLPIPAPIVPTVSTRARPAPGVCDFHPSLSLSLPVNRLAPVFVGHTFDVADYLRRRTRTRSMARRPRTPIARREALAFLIALLAQIEVPFVRVGRYQFQHPYNGDMIETVPDTMEDLLDFYAELSDFHHGLPLMGMDSLSEEEEDEEEAGEEGGIVGDDVDDDFELPDELPGDLRSWHKPRFFDRAYHCDVWLRYILREHGTEQGHYDEQYGPIALSGADFLVLSTEGPAQSEERVNVALRVCKNSSPEEEDYTKLYYDAGIVDRAYVSVVRATQGTFNSGVLTPREPVVVHPAPSTSGGGAGPLQRLSYANDNVCVDHPMITYCTDGMNKAFAEVPIRDPWLRQNYVPNVCWLSQIIEMVNTSSRNVVLTYEKLWRIMGRAGAFNPIEAQLGLHIADLIPVFDWFDRTVNVVDGAYDLVYQRTRSQRRRFNHIRPETWNFLMTEHHVYAITVINAPTRLIGWNHAFTPNQDGYDEIADIHQHPYQKLSPLLPAKDFVAPMEVRLREGLMVLRLDVDASLHDIIHGPDLADLTLVVLVEGSVVDRVVLPLLRDYNYKPTVFYAKSMVMSAVVRSMEGRGFILFKQVDSSVFPPTTDEWGVYQSMKHGFYRSLLRYASTFNEETMSYLHRHVRGGTFAWTNFDARGAIQGSTSMTLSSVDMNRLYPSTLLRAARLPTVTVFDSFVPLRDGLHYMNAVGSMDLCLVAFYDTSTIYSDRSMALCFRCNLDRFLQRPGVYLVDGVKDVPLGTVADGQTFVIVKAYLQTASMPNTLEADIDRVWSSEDLSRSLRKRALNLSIGKMGTTVNEGSHNTHCFTTREEADVYCAEHANAKMLAVADDLYLCQIAPERVTRLQGCYLIHLWVLDCARWAMQDAYDLLTAGGVNVVYCCCDELYYPSEQDALVDAILAAHNPHLDDPETLDAFGHLKRHHRAVPADQIHARSAVIGTNGPFLYMGAEAIQTVDDEVALMNLQHTHVQVVTPEPSEYHIENIPRHNRLLIQATVPGAGKSHAILSMDPERTLVVCPTNALCVEFMRNYPGCTAMTLHRFLRIGILDSLNPAVGAAAAADARDGSPFPTSDVQQEHNMVLLLDEIFMYPLELLVRLRFRLDISTARAIYATGDRHQLPPVGEEEDAVAKSRRERAIDYLFPRQMTLRQCKRMHLEEDNRAMEAICSEILQKDIRGVKLIVRMAFRDVLPDDAIRRLQEPHGDYIAVCYYNHTCKQIAKRVLGSKIRVGVRLVNRKQFRRQGKTILHVNYEFEIVAVTETHVTLCPVDDKTARIESIPVKHVDDHMHWHRTRTCHSLQGSSVSGKLLLFDLRSRYITREFIYVALTRARNLSEVYIVKN